MIKAPPVTPSNPTQRIDYHDLTSLSNQLMQASEELGDMSDAVAKARTIREFASDLRKRALALATREFLDSDSATAAEVKGRGSIRYGDELKQLQADLQTSENTIAKYEAARIKWESIRSSLGCLKAVAGNI